MRMLVLYFLMFLGCSGLLRSKTFEVNKLGHVSYPLITHKMSSSDFILPYPAPLTPDQIEVKRLLGKIDILNERGQRDTSMRVFEAAIDGKRAWLKEFLPVSSKLGKRELATTRRGIGMYNRRLKESLEGAERKDGKDVLINQRPIPPLPLPTVLGSLLTDDRIEDPDFQEVWRSQFPGVRPPNAGNIWLIYQWDESSFNSIRSFPPLPQVVDGADYFSPKRRARKRWKFIRKVFFRSLEACDFLHRAGCSHNSINSDSLWLTTTNELELEQLYVSITDLGTSTFLKEELQGSQGKVAIFEDFYVLGFCFLELALASFTDDFRGANHVRKKFGEAISKRRNEGDKKAAAAVPASTFMPEERPIYERELQSLFEVGCDSDFKKLRQFILDAPGYRVAAEILDLDDNGGWKLIFQLLARGRLYAEGKQKKVSGRSFIRDNAVFFADLL